VSEALVIAGVAVKRIVGVSRITRTLCAKREDVVVDKELRRVLRVGSVRVGDGEGVLLFVALGAIDGVVLDTGGPLEGAVPRIGMLVLPLCEVVAWGLSSSGRLNRLVRPFTNAKRPSSCSRARSRPCMNQLLW